MNIKDYIREVPDFPVEGVMFKDITPLLADANAFQYTVNCIADYCVSKNIDCIVSPDARGWIFSSAVAYKLGIPLHILRKPGKLPPPVKTVNYDYEYASGTLELPAHTDFTDKTVCVIDDVNATGGTAFAAASMFSNNITKDVYYACVIDLTFLGGSRILNANGIETFSVVAYD